MRAQIRGVLVRRVDAIAAFMVTTLAGCSSAESVTTKDNVADAGPDAVEGDSGVCVASDDKGELSCADGGP